MKMDSKGIARGGIQCLHLEIAPEPGWGHGSGFGSSHYRNGKLFQKSGSEAAQRSVLGFGAISNMQSLLSVFGKLSISQNLL